MSYKSFLQRPSLKMLFFLFCIPLPFQMEVSLETCMPLEKAKLFLFLNFSLDVYRGFFVFFFRVCEEDIFQGASRSFHGIASPLALHLNSSPSNCSFSVVFKKIVLGILLRHIPFLCFKDCTFAFVLDKHNYTFPPHSFPKESMNRNILGHHAALYSCLQSEKLVSPSALAQQALGFVK